MNRSLPLMLIAIAVVAQLAPHPFNVSPLAALGLFAGALLSPRLAWTVPIAGLLAANLVNGVYAWQVLVCVYAGMLAGPVCGRLLLARRRTVRRFAGGTLVSATLFYLVSNFGIWWAGMYPPNLAGLIECYLMGLPFFGKSLAADLVYGAILFGGMAMARQLSHGTNRVA